MKKLYFLLLFCLLLSVETIAQITTHIVGGDDTDIDEVPWQVLIETNTPLNGILDACGGTIIAPNWILTACHCTFDPANGNPLNGSQIKIYAGITLRGEKNNGQIRNVVEIIRHPDYGTNPDSRFDHDIALLRLSSPLILNNEVQVIDYATQADANAGWTDPGRIATVSGWGRLFSGGNQPNHLQSINIPIVDNATAAGQYNPLIQDLDITANMLAAGNVGIGGQDACQGDSGGPLVVQDASDRDILAGIVSFGRYCADPNFLGIYTRVSRYCDWIADEIAAVTGPSNVCSPGTFSISNIPNDATVAWEVSPSNLVDISSGTGTSASIEPASLSANGEATITFTISGSCGTTAISEDFWVGAKKPDRFISVLVEPYLGRIKARVEPVPGATSYIWYLDGIQYTGLGMDGEHAVLPISKNDCSVRDYSVAVKAVNECGTSAWLYEIHDNPCYNGEIYYTYSPNPASEDLIVEENELVKNSNYDFGIKAGKRLELYNFNGELVYQGKISKKTKIDVSVLEPGRYILKILLGKGMEEKHHIIIN